MSCHPNHITAAESRRRSNTERFSREISRQHKWTPGHDPNDPDAEEGSGWEYVKISSDNMQEDKSVPNPYVRKHGPASGIACFFCVNKQADPPEMRIVDERSVEDIIKGMPGYDIMVAHGTIPKLASILMLICPKCEKTAQIREDVVRRALIRKSLTGWGKS